MIILLVGLSAIFLQISDGYVLLQVRKQDDNHSNVDALIHKVVPSDKFEKFAQKMTRKPSINEEVSVNSEQKRIKYPTDEDNNIKLDEDYKKQDGGYGKQDGGYVTRDGEYKIKQSDGYKKKNGDISLVFDDKNADADLVKVVDVAIKQLSKSSGPIMRTSDQDQEIKPRTIKFRSGESSILYEINSQSVIGAIKELLSSKAVRNYLDTLTRKAAVVYRAMTGSNNNK